MVGAFCFIAERLKICYNNDMQFTKRNIIIMVITFAAVAVAVALFVWFFRRENAIVRDMARLEDIRAIQSGFERMIIQENSYEVAAEGCGEVGDVASACALENYLTDVSLRKDPGDFAYTVTKVPGKDNYEITFTLEHGNATLPAGKHTLTPNGIQ